MADQNIVTTNAPKSPIGAVIPTKDIYGDVGFIHAKSLLRRTQLPLRRPLTLTADAPTITWSATTPASGRRIRCTAENVTLVGCGLLWNDATNSAIVSPRQGFAGAEFILNGTSMTFAWKSESATRERFLFYVDGLPVSLTPATPSVTTVAGTVYYCTLTFGATGVRNIEIIGTAIAEFSGITIPVTASLSKSPPKRRVFLSGDSFISGSGAIALWSDLVGSVLGKTYNCSVAAYGFGGSGYTVNGGTGFIYGDPVRTTYISRFNPDDIVLLGSVNDDANAATVQAAVEACLAAYKIAAPSANILVFGPPPTGHTSTLSTVRTNNNKAVKAGCNAAGVQFVDMIGSATYDTIPDFVSGTTYNPGAVVSYLGSVWRFGNGSALAVSTATGYPGTGLYSRWDLVTKHLFGTGHSVTTAGDGSRDTLLYGVDSVHPTVAQCVNLAHMIAEHLFSSEV